MRHLPGFRGCHPKQRSSSFRHWCFDDLTFDQARNCTHPNVDPLVLHPASAWANSPPVNTPEIIDGPIGGKARSFQRYPAGSTGSILSSFGDATSTTNHQGNLTWGAWVKINDFQGGTRYVYSYQGLQGVETAPENYLFSVRTTSGRQISLFWEYGAGVNVTSTFPDYRMPLGEWVYLVIVKSNQTGPGPGGTCDLALWANGIQVDQLTGVTNCSDGSNSWYLLGAEMNATSGLNFGEFDCAGMYLWNDPLTPEEIRDDFQRGSLLPFFTRMDLQVSVEDPVDPDLSHELTDFHDLDWVDQVTISDSAGDATMTAQVDLLREQEDQSLAYLRTDTLENRDNPLDLSAFDPAIDIGRRIEIRAARVPLFTRGRPSQFHSLFLGLIDEVAWGGTRVTLQCRDQGSYLIDHYIEDERDYSDDPPPDGAGPFAVEGEMAQLLLDNSDLNYTGSYPRAATGGPELYVQAADEFPVVAGTVPSPVNWAVTKWRARREPVMTALRQLAGQIGWECRFRYREGLGWILLMYDPDRQRGNLGTTNGFPIRPPNWLLGPQDILNVTSLKINQSTIRNVVRVAYPSSVQESGSFPTPNPLSNFGITGPAVEDQGWVDTDAKRGRMMAYYQIQLTDSVTRYGRRFMEVSEASSSQIDTVIEAQRMAVAMALDLQEPDLDKGISIPLAPEVELGDQIHFLPIEQLFTGAQALSVVSVSHTFGDAAETTLELRGKPSLGFRRWLALETRPGNAEPGVIDPVDALTDQRTGSLLQTIRSLVDDTDFFTQGKFLAVKNSSFQFFSGGLESYPDFWGPDDAGDTWGPDPADALYYDTDSLSGTYSVRFRDSTGGPVQELLSDLIPVQGDGETPLIAQLTWKLINAASDDQARMDLLYFGADRLTSTGVDVITFDDLNSGDWNVSRQNGITPPAGTKFVRIRLERVDNVGTDSDILMDSVALYYGGRELSSYLLNGFLPTGPTGSWYNIPFSSPATLPDRFWDYGTNFTTLPNSSTGFLAKESGIYRVQVRSMWHSISDSNATSQIRLVRNATYNGGTNLRQHNSGDVLFIGPTNQVVLASQTGVSGFPVGTNYACRGIVTADVELEQGDHLTAEWYYDTNMNLTGGAFFTPIDLSVTTWSVKLIFSD